MMARTMLMKIYWLIMENMIKNVANQLLESYAGILKQQVCGMLQIL